MANILTPFGLTPEHFARIDQMKTDPSSFGFKNQFDYARASGKDLVDRSMPGFGISSMMGQVLATPFYDTYSGIQESKKPYKDDFTQYSGITDYGEMPVGPSLSEVAKGIKDERIGTMMGGRFLGGIDALRERNPGVTGTDYFNDINISQPPGTDVGIMSDIANLFGSSARADEIEPMDVENFLEANRLKSTPNVVDVNRIPGRIQEAVEPQYRIRDQLSRDFLEGGLFRDAKQGLSESKNKFLQDISGLRQGLGSIKDRAVDIFGSGKELALRGIGSIFGGPVGGFIGGVLGGLKESPTDKFNLEIGREFGDRYGYKSALQHGNLGARQDPFGRNLVSFARNYELNRMKEIARLSKLKELTQFQKDKLDFGKKYLEKLEQKRQAKIDDMFAQGQGGSGQDFTGGRFDGAGSRAEYDKDPTGFSGSS